MALTMLFDTHAKIVHGLPAEITIEPIHSPTREWQRYRETEHYDGLICVHSPGNFYVMYRTDTPQYDLIRKTAYANGTIASYDQNTMTASKRTWKLKPQRPAPSQDTKS